MDKEKEAIKEKELLFEKEKKANEKPDTVHKLMGLSLGFLAVFIFVASAVSVQLLEKRIPDLELNTIRCAVSCVTYLLVFFIKGSWPIIPRALISVTCLYTNVAFVCSITMFVSMTLLPAASVQSVQVTCQIAAGVILFALFLKEKVTISLLACALFCVVGILLVIQPDIIFPMYPGNLHFTDEHNTTYNEAVEGNRTIEMDFNLMNQTVNTNIESTGYWKKQILGYGLAAASGVSVALDTLTMKRNPSFSDFILELLFWCTLVGTGISAVAMGIIESPVLPRYWMDVLYVMIHSFGYALNRPLYIYALQYISGNTFTIIWSTSTVFMLIAQYTVLSSIFPGHKNWIEVVGVVLVVIGSSLSSLMNIFMQ